MISFCGYLWSRAATFVCATPDTPSIDLQPPASFLVPLLVGKSLSYDLLKKPDSWEQISKYVSLSPKPLMALQSLTAVKSAGENACWNAFYITENHQNVQISQNLKHMSYLRHITRKWAGLSSGFAAGRRDDSRDRDHCWRNNYNIC